MLIYIYVLDRFTVILVAGCSSIYLFVALCISLFGCLEILFVSVFSYLFLVFAVVFLMKLLFGQKRKKGSVWIYITT